MTDKLEDTGLRLKDEMDLYRKIMDKLWQNRHEFQKEKEAMQEVRRFRVIEPAQSWFWAPVEPFPPIGPETFPQEGLLESPPPPRGVLLSSYRGVYFFYLKLSLQKLFL